MAQNTLIIDEHLVGNRDHRSWVHWDGFDLNCITALKQEALWATYLTRQLRAKRVRITIAEKMAVEKLQFH